ncbi:hypothetical protein ACQPXB_45255 [Amycolatopsis sp. CA-161197]|uniref:hypothetical protein n=1 Tax=Amycolatopsis sp. CA-161197 TaxID=3239922 RepID=UPI003D92EC59
MSVFAVHGVVGRTRRLYQLAGLAALTLILTACDSSVGGNPSPEPSVGSSGATAPLSNTPLAGMSSCKTLDQAIAGQGFPASKPSIADLEHACDALKAGYGDIGLNLQDGQSYDSDLINPISTKTGNVGHRRAILELQTNHQSGACAVSIEIKPKSRAIVLAVLSSAGPDEACAEARKVAEAVEPLLPANT